MNKKILTVVAALTAATTFGDWFSGVGGMAGFAKNIPITVASDVSDAVTDLPVLVRISESAINGFYYSDLANPDTGMDIVFLDDSGNVLPHEIDTWNPQGESLIWVKLPVAATGTTFTMNYGNPSVTSAPPDSEYKFALWNNYHAVWHMGEVFEAGATAAEKTAYDSTANAMHGMATDSSDNGDKLAKMLSVADGAVGVARNNQSGKSKKGAHLLAGDSSFTHGSYFTISGWFDTAEKEPNGTPRLICRKAGYKDGSGFEITTPNWNFNSIVVRGASSGSQTVECPYKVNATYNNSGKRDWHHYTFVYDFTSVSVYQDGVLIQTVEPGKEAKDSSHPLAIGCDADGDECVYNGCYDEVRFNKGVCSSDFIAAEYAAMSDAAFLSYGEVGFNDESMIGFEHDAAALQEGDELKLSVSVVNGSGSIYVVYTDLLTDEVSDPVFVKEIDGFGKYEVVPVDLTDGHLYSAVFHGISTGGSESFSDPVEFLFGQVAIVRVADANEVGLVPGSFVVSIPVALDRDYVCTYSIGGTALAGRAYVALPGSVTIPAGETSATIEVVPLYDSLTRADSTVSVTLQESASIPAERTATLTILDDPSAVTDPRIRYVATTGSDEADGLTPQTAFKTVAKGVEVITEEGGTVFVAAGTYTETNAFPCVKTGATATNGNACVILKKPIAIVGESGNPADVVITRESQQARILYFDHPDASVSGVTIRGGDGRDLGGGAVLITSNGGTLQDCIIENGNSTKGVWDAGGGNIYMDGGLVSRCIVRNGESHNHGSGRNGGGIFAYGGLIENSLIYGNKCANSASVVLRNTAMMVNCTVTAHSAGSCSGVRAEKTTKVINCAIFGNTCTSDTTDPQHQHVWAGTDSVFDACAGEIEPNDTCFAAPLAGFAAPDNNDYTLTGGSVCLDKGKDYAKVQELLGVKLSATDLAGNPREDGVVDIGCYEYVHGQLSADFFSEEPAATLPAADVTFTAKVMDALGACTFQWDFDGDGTVDQITDDPVVTARYTDAGRFTVILTVTDESAATATATHADYVFIGAEKIYADANSANPVYPYSTLETAATDIQDAIDAGYNGSEVIVIDGTYERTMQLTVMTGINLHSQSGDPSKCIIYNTSGRNLEIDNAQAVVYGFTFEHGRVDQGEGSAIKFGPQGGTVKNCIVRDASVSNYAGDGAVRMANGSFSHCIIEDSWKNPARDGSNDPKTSQALTLLGNATADNCLIRNCGHEDVSHLVYVAGSAVLENCTIVNGNVPDGSYAINVASSSAQIRNCVIANVPCSKTTTPTAVEGEEPPEPVTTHYQIGGTVSCVRHCAMDAELPEGVVNCVQSTPAAMFRNFAGGDFRPMVSGPLTNVGETPVIEMEVDLAGKPRIVGKGGIDIGCYESSALGAIILVR